MMRTTMIGLRCLMFGASVLLLAACSSSPALNSNPEAGPRADLPRPDAQLPASDAVEAGPKPSRTMVQRALFGLAHPQNLVLDPSFSVRFGGLGTWMTTTADTAQQTASLSASPMSDSPSGIALPVGRLSDAKNSTSNFRLDAVTQVAGGPGPFNLRVWISTLDASASATLSGVGVGLLTSQAGNAVTVSEDASRTQVIAGRTWHLFSGTISDSLTLGGYVALEFAASTNTWLLQGPELIPQAIDPTPPAKSAARRPQVRNMTDHEKQLVIRYRRQPRISVPAGHRSLSDRRRALRR